MVLGLFPHFCLIQVGEDGSDDDEGAEEPAPAEGANGPGPADSASASATLVSIAADDAPTDPLQVAGDPLQVTETAAQEKAAWQDPLLSPQNTSRGDKKSTVGLDVPRKVRKKGMSVDFLLLILLLCTLFLISLMYNLLVILQVVI